MTYLLDVNVLLSLVWPTHIHNAVSNAWFDDNAATGWATCPITESGFVRLSSHPRITPDAVAPSAAVEMLVAWRGEPGHEFWSDDVSLATSDEVPRARLGSHAQVTDAHLLTLARRRGGRVVTFDRGLAALAQDSPADVVLLGGLPGPRQA